MSLIAIHPDFVSKALSPGVCQDILNCLLDQFVLFEFVLDERQGPLEQAYIDAISSSLQFPFPVAAQFVHRLSSATQPRIQLVPCGHISNNCTVMQLAHRHQCEPDFEQLLLRMACALNDSDMMILLPPRISPRQFCLHERSKLLALQQELRKQGVRLQVESLSNVHKDICLDEQSNSLHKSWGASFEKESHLALLSLKEHPREIQKTPKSWKDSGQPGDVDVWLYDLEGNPRKVWIAECKLRIHNEEAKIRGEDVKQLATRIEAVKLYEQARPETQACAFEIHPFMISNAKTMEEEAWQKAYELGMHYLRAYLSDSWKSSSQLEILKLEKYRPTYAGNSRWEGQLLDVHIIEVKS